MRTTGRYWQKVATCFDCGNGELQRDGARRSRRITDLRGFRHLFFTRSQDRDVRIVRETPPRRSSNEGRLINLARDNVRQVKLQFLWNKTYRTKPYGSASTI